MSNVSVVLFQGWKDNGGIIGVGFYAEKRRDVMPANAGIQGEYAIVQG